MSSKKSPWYDLPVRTNTVVRVEGCHVMSKCQVLKGLCMENENYFLAGASGESYGPSLLKELFPRRKQNLLHECT